MFEISIFLSVIFILSFIPLFCFVRRENKKEEDEGILTLVVISILFSAIITIFFGFALFAIMGSTSVIDKIFSLNINSKQLLIISISYIIYWFTIDDIFEKIFEYIVGENIFALLFLALSRVASFYLIGIIIKLNEVINMTLSIGVPVILLVIEILYYFKDNKPYANH